NKATNDGGTTIWLSSDIAALSSRARRRCSGVRSGRESLQPGSAAMSIELNHTIVHARDPKASADFLAQMLGRPEPVRFGPFHGVELDNGVTLDFIQADDQLIIEHYAFLV